MCIRDSDLVFSTQQVADSDEHRLLMSLRDSELQDLEARQAFYQKAVELSLIHI